MKNKIACIALALAVYLTPYGQQVAPNEKPPSPYDEVYCDGANGVEQCSYQY